MCRYGPTVCEPVSPSLSHGRGPRRRVAAADDDVEAVAERPVGLRQVLVELRHQPVARGGGGDRLEHRVDGEQRVAREVHLRHEPLGERAAEQREVDVVRPPRVRVVGPRVGAGLDGDEAVPAVGVGERPPGAREVRVERRGVLVGLVPVAAGGVGLPDLDQLAGRGRPSSPSTRPDTITRSPIGSPACWRVRSLSVSRSADSPNTGPVSSVSVCGRITSGCDGARSRVPT